MRFVAFSLGLGLTVSLSSVDQVIAAEAAPIPNADIVRAMKALAAHRAVYDIKLATRGDGGSVSRAEGRIVYEFTGSACAGFSTQYRFVTRFQPQSGPERLSDLRTSSFEDGAGTSYDFFNQSFLNQVLTEESRGRANRKDGSIAVDLVKPKTDKVTVSGDALFPTQHLAALIEAAKRGDQVVNLKLYDGTDTGTKVTLASTVIGKELAANTVPDDEPSAAAAELKGLRSWPMTVSYFDADKPQGSGEAVPDYQLAFVVYETGVTRHLQLNFNEFVLDGRLSTFTPIAEKPCD
jgi:hypothetical protein